MIITQVGERLRLEPSNERSGQRPSEHAVFRHAVINAIINAACDGYPSLQLQEAVSFGEYIANSDPAEATTATAPVVDQVEREAYMGALLLSVQNDEAPWAEVAADLIQQIQTEVTILEEVGQVPDAVPDWLR